MCIYIYINDDNSNNNDEHNISNDDNNDNNGTILKGAAKWGTGDSLLDLRIPSLEIKKSA